MLTISRLFANVLAPDVARRPSGSGRAPGAPQSLADLRDGVLLAIDVVVEHLSDRGTENV
jgi:hypothetical protein